MATRRRTIWATWHAANVNLGAVGTARVELNTLIDATRPGLGEYTITRTIGKVLFGIQAATTDRHDCYAGLITHPATNDVNSVPDPFNEPHADWMWWEFGWVPRSDIDAGNRILEMRFDVASQRKQREFERDFSLMLHQRGTTALDFSVGGRCLLKLG